MSARNADISLTFAGADQCIAVVRLARPAKRNALSDGLIAALRDIFQTLPDTVRAAQLQAEPKGPAPGADQGVHGGDFRRATAALGRPGIEAIVARTVAAIRQQTSR